MERTRRQTTSSSESWRRRDDAGCTFGVIRGFGHRSLISARVNLYECLTDPITASRSTAPTRRTVGGRRRVCGAEQTLRLVVAEREVRTSRDLQAPRSSARWFEPTGYSPGI